MENEMVRTEKGAPVSRWAATAAETPWGWAGLAATGWGLLACVWPYDDPARALEALDREAANVVGKAAHRGSVRGDPQPPYDGESLLQQAAAALLRFFDGRVREIADIPIDGRYYTAWERRVYEAVRRIAPGSVRSYGEVAAACGNKSAARAVGQAMAGNPVVLFMPCHRVVRWDRTPGNYGSGGTAMKQRLLAHEAGSAGENS
jgi:methylated-DNA-[protein]-cysteine S-methyltransferase